jgi:hypothetical protein
MACDLISVDRICVSGSFGKKTALPSFDIDLVLFVNGTTPPFETELKRLYKYLSTNVPGIEMKKASPYSITFYLKGFKVDLLLAPNFVTKPSENPKKEQHQALLQDITAKPPRDRLERARYLSPAFSETVVDFMKKRRPFVNAAVRVAKLWKTSCAVNGSTFPRWFTSFLVELVVSDKAEAELQNKPDDASLVRALKAFFEQLSNPNNLNLVFTENYDESAIPESIRKERPIVLDPSNPYLNVAKPMDWEVIKLLAQHTLAVLNKAESHTSTMDDLFHPRLGEDISRLFRQLNFQLRFVKHGGWMRSVQVRKIADLEGKMMSPGVTWRATEKLDRDDASRIAKPRILGMLDTLVKVTDLAMSHHIYNGARNGISEVVAACNFIDAMLLEVFDTPRQQWGPSSERHEDRDVTCLFGQIPIPSNEDDLRYLYFCLSFNVDDAGLEYIANCIAVRLRRCQEEESDEY